MHEDLADAMYQRCLYENSSVQDPLQQQQVFLMMILWDSLTGPAMKILVPVASPCEQLL